MPELPEVEIVRQSLSKNIKGKKINKVLVRNRNLRFKLKPYFEKRLENQSNQAKSRLQDLLPLLEYLGY